MSKGVSSSIADPLLRSLLFRDILERHGIRVRFVGRREMLPKQVLQTFEDIERLTAGNTKCAYPAVDGVDD